MQFVTVASRLRYSDDKLVKVGLFETDRLFCDLYCLQPGQAQTVHTHSGSDKIYYVLEGRASVQVGGERQEFIPGQAVLAPSGMEHGVANAADGPLVLLVFMAPKPSH